MEGLGRQVEILELEPEADQVPETRMMPAEYEVEIHAPPVTSAAASGPVIQTVSFTATNSTINLGCSIQEDNSVKTSGLKREEWSRLEEEYGDEAWMIPFSWDPKWRFDPEVYFVSLTLDYLERDGQRSRSVKAELNNLFDCPVQDGNVRANRVLVRGLGGFGKTTLCTKVAYDWRWGKTSITSLPCDSTLIAFYKLRFFDSTKDLEEELFQFLYQKHSVEGKSMDATKETLKALGRDLVFFLDGYDELDKVGQTKLHDLIWSCKLGICSTFPKASFLVTSRPCDRKEFLDAFEKHYTMGELPRSKVEEMVDKYFENDVEKSKVFLERRYRKFELENVTPLNLFLLFWVSQHEDNEQLSQGQGLVFRCMVLLARRCNVRHDLKLSDEDIKKCFFRLGMLFLTHGHYMVISHEELEAYLVDQRFPPLVRQMGILQHCQKSKIVFHYFFIERLFSYFCKETCEMSSKCSTQQEYQDFCHQVFETVITKKYGFNVILYFPAKKDFIIIWKYQKKFQIKVENGILELRDSFNDRPKKQRFSFRSKIIKQEKILNTLLKFCSEGNKSFFFKVLSTNMDNLYIDFEDILDHRARMLSKRMIEMDTEWPAEVVRRAVNNMYVNSASTVDHEEGSKHTIHASHARSAY